RSSNTAILSGQDHRFGSLLIDSAVAVNAPIDVATRETINDDDYLRVFQILDSLDRAERRQRWERIALSVKRITRLSFKPGWRTSRVAPDVQTPAQDDSVVPIETRTGMNFLTGHPAS